jgi:hypothetical protein
MGALECYPCLPVRKRAAMSQPERASDRSRMSTPYLSKSRYLSGLKCDLQLWLDGHERKRATPYGAAQEHIFRMGNEVGEAARNLFPKGVLIEEDYANHDGAVKRTREWMADPAMPAIFEAAFEHETVRIRVDILERREDGNWGLREVKAAGRVKRELHSADLRIQRWVLEGCGLKVDSAELLHVNGRYVRGEGAVEWSEFFERVELIEELNLSASVVVSDQVTHMRGIMAESLAPVRAPGEFCRKNNLCRYWDDCTRDFSPEEIAELTPAKKKQKAQRARTGPADRPWYSPALSKSLAQIDQPVWALDFEAIGPAIPLYPGTRAYQAVAFQWSLHRLGLDGAVEHFEFLAGGRQDPRPEVAAALIKRLADEPGSILAYSGYESRCLADMAKRSPELADALQGIAARLVDLLPIVKKHVDHPGFGGSYSMKSVGPVLAGSVAYADLEGVADGLGALATFAGIVQGRFSAEEEQRFRKELLAYCKLDTRALLGVYEALVREAEA